MYLQIYCCVSEHNTKTGKSPVMYCLDISWILCKCCVSIVFATFGCKVTENIWNTQGFQQENANSFVFCAAKPCYLHKCADVISRWDGYAVSVPSTLHQIFNFFDICKREGDFVLFLSLGHLSLFSRSWEGVIKEGKATESAFLRKVQLFPRKV